MFSALKKKQKQQKVLIKPCVMACYLLKIEWTSPPLVTSLIKEERENIVINSFHLINEIFCMCLNLLLYFSDGLKWKTRRRLITPTFHFSTLNTFLQVFEEQSKILVSNLEVTV